MSSRKASILGHIIYRPVVFFGLFFIYQKAPVWFYNEEVEAKQNRMIQDIQQRPASDWFKYHKVESTKDRYDAGTNIYFRSTRTIQANPPYITVEQMKFIFSEFLMCDYNDGEGFTRVDPESVTTSIKVTPGTYTTARWKRTGGVPYYIPAQCYLQSRICLMVQGIEKCQYIESNIFGVN